MTKPGIYSDIAEDTYHADRCSLSVSGAKLLLPPSCPAKFRHRQDNPQPPNRVFDFGHVAHTLILGKGSEIVTIDAPDFRTKDAKELRDQAYAGGKVPILSSEYAKAVAMADKVMGDPIAGPMLQGDGQAEVSLYAPDESGVLLRGRVDWLSDEIVDYKTSSTANPEELQRKFFSYGYFMQAAWYMDLVVALGILETPRFRFVVQEKEPPHIVTVVEYDGEAIQEGRRLNRMAVDLYKRCTDTNTWPAYTDQTITLSLPYWALKARDQAIYDEAAELERNWDDFIAS